MTGQSDSDQDQRFFVVVPFSVFQEERSRVVRFDKTTNKQTFQSFVGKRSASHSGTKTQAATKQNSCFVSVAQGLVCKPTSYVLQFWQNARFLSRMTCSVVRFDLLEGSYAKKDLRNGVFRRF